ncbi:MAG: exodeoxyribonuclease VII small subunit [Candidatus Omnitrophica bacterium CG11_big_fil_rev_8_21_14_0_20_42_13]|uniref:Exodeoxyribonuclease 7 small subunit n=1 Tax=Candidatus Ghiorseimicrobium undicola TaxID=1974746 RepID=A0A2H0LX16_9BACT|nr:MAG: exodeoxyribonuclease VII small subunit [Candidatus Omnitrophica bacterium CG11_big_fil_rev_8_21_14_0_20_42_13]
MAENKKNDSKQLGFEEALARIEKIVAELEGGKLTIEDAVKKYEEGIRLAGICSKTLDSAKRKVEVLMKKEGASLDKRFETEELEESQGLE